MVKLIGELIEGIAGRAGLKNVREFGESLTKPGKGLSGGRGGRTPREAAGRLRIGSARPRPDDHRWNEEHHGTGQPRTRRRLRSSAVEAQRRRRDPEVRSTPTTAGTVLVSYAYADQNTRQQVRSDAMAEADHEVHKVLYREAAQITLRRGYLDDQYNFLANTSYVTFPLQFIPRYGEAMKLGDRNRRTADRARQELLPDEPAEVRGGTERRPTAAGGRPILGRCRRRRITRRRSQFRSAAPTTGRRSPAGDHADGTIAAAHCNRRDCRLAQRFRWNRPRACRGFRADGHGGHVDGARAPAKWRRARRRFCRCRRWGLCRVPWVDSSPGPCLRRGSPPRLLVDPAPRKLPGGHSTTSRQRTASPTSWPTTTRIRRRRRPATPSRGGRPFRSGPAARARRG